MLAVKVSGTCSVPKNAFIPWFPLAVGRLAEPGGPLDEIAGRHDATPAQIALAWLLLFVWHWFYGVAYRYRRRLLKYTSVFVVFAMTVALAYFTMERAAPQRAMVASHEVVDREGIASLYWSAVATLAAGMLLLVHLVFLGRGYRQKRTAGWSPF